MFVTLDVFSGRPNPSWRLSNKDAQQLTERTAGKSVMTAEVVDNLLGYRGLTVSATSDEQLPETMPASFRIGGALPTEYAVPESVAPTLSAEETEEAVVWLLSTGRHVVDEALLAYVEDTLQMRKRGLETEAPAEPLGEEEVSKEEADLVARAVCTIRNTPYNPGFWNRSEVIPHNNCYNYAMNYRSDTFAQPGRISGHPTGIMDCAHVATAANWDGCTATCSGSNKNVALVIWPGVDYHWYRKHSEGFWGHKPGGTAARNTDNRGRLIDGRVLTPLTCDRGPYTVFCGYRYSPTGMRVR